jgi:hypothetical protein
MESFPRISLGIEIPVIVAESRPSIFNQKLDVTDRLKKEPRRQKQPTADINTSDIT